MIVKDAPGALNVITGSAQYDIANGCLPPATPIVGAQTAPSMAFADFAIARVSENAYQGTIFVDRMLESDYYGDGICRWKVAAITVNLKATGAPEETVFSTHLHEKDMYAGRSVDQLFPENGSPAQP